MYIFDESIDYNQHGVKLIFIHGGNKDSVEIAARAGWYYGTTWGKTCYGLPYMSDYVGTGADWDKYMDFLRSHRPRQALVMDLRSRTEWRECTRRMCDVAEMGIRPVVVAKYVGALKLIPEYVLGVKSIIGVSVPTKAGYMDDGDGTLPTQHDFKQSSAHFYDSKFTGGMRDVHLLGGQPDQWAYLMQYYAGAANVYSIDGNSLLQLARKYGKVWSARGYYREMRGTRWNTGIKTIASMRNARRFLDQDFYLNSERVTMCKQALGLVHIQKTFI